MTRQRETCSASQAKASPARNLHAATRATCAEAAAPSPRAASEAETAPAPSAAASARSKRICRTPDEAFAAGWEDGANDAPLTPEQRRHILGLIRPYRDALVQRPAA